MVCNHKIDPEVYKLFTADNHIICSKRRNTKRHADETTVVNLQGQTHIMCDLEAFLAIIASD